MEIRIKTKSERERAAEWAQMHRLEKIRVIKEKMQDNKTLTVRIKPAIL